MRTAVIVAREFKSFFQDRGDVFFNFILPVALALLMVQVFGGGGELHLSAHVVDEDGGEYAERLVTSLAGDMEINMLSREQAEDRLNRSYILQALIIPRGFSEAASGGEVAEIVILSRGSGGIEGQIVRSMIRGHIADLEVELDTRSGIINVASAFGFDTDDPMVTRYAEEFIRRDREAPPVTVNTFAVGETRSPVVDFLPGILTMFLLFGVTLNAQSLVDERKRATLVRMLVSGTRPAEMFAGKYLAQVVRGLAQAAIILAIMQVVFGVFTLSSFVLALAVSGLFLLAVSGIGLLIGSLFTGRDAATWAAVFVTMGMSVAGGTFYDPTGAGGPLETLAHYTLNYHANRGIQAVMLGGGPGEIVPVAAILLGAFVLVAALSLAFFRVEPGGGGRG